MKYRYLLFDIDGTVLDFLAQEKNAIKNLFLEFGFGECTDKMIEVYSKINVKYWEKLERNEMTKPEILVSRFKEFFEVIGLDSSLAEKFNSEYQSALGDTIIFCDNSKDILLSLKGKYKLAAITNGTKEAQDKKLSKSGLINIFDNIFISEVVGIEKPNIGFFDFVKRKMGIEDLSSVLVIGDSLTSDIKGGINMGVDTCYYNPKKKANNTENIPTYEIYDLHEIVDILNR